MGNTLGGATCILTCMSNTQRIYRLEQQLAITPYVTRMGIMNLLPDWCLQGRPSKSMGMVKFDPQPTLNPWTDRHQIWTTWLRHGRLPPRKIRGQSVQGFLHPHTRKYTHGNEIWDKIGYNLACVRNISEIVVSSRGVFGVGLLNDAVDARQILPRPIPVAMATKFKTKSAITRLL